MFFDDFISELGSNIEERGKLFTELSAYIELRHRQALAKQAIYEGSRDYCAHKFLTARSIMDLQRFHDDTLHSNLIREDHMDALLKIVSLLGGARTQFFEQEPRVRLERLRALNNYVQSKIQYTPIEKEMFETVLKTYQSMVELAIDDNKQRKSSVLNANN